MDQHKIENFAKAHPSIAFPAYLHLEGSRASAIQGSIAKAFELPGRDGLELVKKLQVVGTDTGGLQANDSAFSLAKLLRESGVTSQEKVYLNWYRFDDIDQMSLADLDRYFFDIWYPDSDDLDIFDDSADWIVSIAHHGKVRIFRK